MAQIQSAPRNPKKDGFVVWFTGLPASGKTTLAATLALNLRERFPRVELLDMDDARAHLGPAADGTKAGPEAGERRLGFVAQRLSRNGVAAVVAAVSPKRQVRADVRASVERFVEVFCDAPVEVAEKRDAKGIYAKARRGELQDVPGVNGPYEAPEQAEVVCRTAEQPVEECVLQVLKHLEQEGHIARRSSRAGPLVIRPLPMPAALKHAGRVAASVARAAAAKAGGLRPARPVLVPVGKPIPIGQAPDSAKPAPAVKLAAEPAGEAPVRPLRAAEPKAVREAAGAKAPKAAAEKVAPAAAPPKPKKASAKKPAAKKADQGAAAKKAIAKKSPAKKAAKKAKAPKKAIAKKSPAKTPAKKAKAPKPAAKKASAPTGGKLRASKGPKKTAKAAAKKKSKR